MIDYYEILEISPNASQEVIREVYKVLLHRYNVEHDAEDRSEIQKLHQLNLAYEVLSDFDKRQIYDEEFGKAKTFQNEAAQQNQSPLRTMESQAFDANSNECMALLKTKPGASNNASFWSRLRWNKWGWSVSILAVAAILISMVRPDPDKALRGQLAVQSHAEKKELKTEVEKTAAENKHPDSVENKVTAK
jgi:curved DNA-binding protein CbpA